MKDLLFYVLSTLFQAYQDGERVIMKGYMQWKSLLSRKDIKSQLDLTPRQLDQEEFPH